MDLCIGMFAQSGAVGIVYSVWQAFNAGLLRTVGCFLIIGFQEGGGVDDQALYNVTPDAVILVFLVIAKEGDERLHRGRRVYPSECQRSLPANGQVVIL